MADYNQIASIPNPYTDLPAKNYSGSTIAAALAVIVDTSNVVSPTSSSNTLPGIAVPGSAGVPIFGVTVTDIAAGANGLIRTGGAAWIKCEGSITAGTLVQASTTSSKVGWAKALTSAKAQIGMALSSSTDGELILVLLQPANNA